MGEQVLESSMQVKLSQKKGSQYLNPESQLTVPKMSTLSIIRSPINTPGVGSHHNFAETLITQSDFTNNHHKDNSALIDAHD